MKGLSFFGAWHYNRALPFCANDYFLNVNGEALVTSLGDSDIAP